VAQSYWATNAYCDLEIAIEAIHCPRIKLRSAVAVACLVAGTLVHTREGLRPIHQVKVGDYVLSRSESGSGETAYKRVLNTFEFDDKATWFISWYVNPDQRLRSTKTVDEYQAAHGQSFVITTPDHMFWVIESEDDMMRWDETSPYRAESGPGPRQQWVKADRIAAGMTLLVADGRRVHVGDSKRVYKTDLKMQGWVALAGDRSKGLMIDFANQRTNTAMHVHAGLFVVPQVAEYGLLANPNDHHADDWPPGSAPETWYRSKVYNLEVEDFHTYFVDQLGVWVRGYCDLPADGNQLILS
jgi:hypothetical protein